MFLVIRVNHMSEILCRTIGTNRLFNHIKQKKHLLNLSYANTLPTISIKDTEEFIGF